MRNILCISLLIFFAQSCEKETHRLDQYSVHGIDVSHHQKQIVWDTVAAQRVHFAFVKATEGASFADSLFCYNWDEMKRVGLRRGAYHFYRPNTSPMLQAMHFSNWVEMEEGDLPPVLDVEVLDDANPYGLVAGIRTWLALVEWRHGVKPIIYTNLRFYNEYLSGQFNDYPVWIARYNQSQPELSCGRDWDFWQYGNRGNLPGIDGYVDFNVYNGTFEQLDSLCRRGADLVSMAY